MAYQFNDIHKSRFKKQGEGQAAWIKTNPDNARKQTKTILGLTVEICAENAEPINVIKKKEKALIKAIECLQNAGLMFTDSDVKKFRVVYYAHHLVWETQSKPSRGAVYFENVSDTKPCVLLQLGTRIASHVLGVKEEGVAGGWSNTNAQRVLADRIYDYYKLTWTVNAATECALAQTLHELGHIIHQLKSPDDYWLNADVAEGKEPNAKLKRQAEFDSIKKYGHGFVSQYAGTDAKSLNEYVAEVFAGIMMGIPWDTIDPSKKLMQIYEKLGGPIPTTMPDSISRVNDFKTCSCNCVANISKSHEDNKYMYFY